MKVCEVCGLTEKEKEIVTFHGKKVCQKHKMQLFRHGKIIDASKESRADRHKLFVKNEYAEFYIDENQIIIDIDDMDKVLKHKWHVENGYVRAKINKKNVPLHRYVMNYSGDKEIDHINHNKLDNRKKNLRIVTRAENMHNTIGKGIFKDKNKWRVQLMRYGKKYCVGLYDSYEVAVMARNNFLSVYFPEDILCKVR